MKKWPEFIQRMLKKDDDPLDDIMPEEMCASIGEAMAQNAEESLHEVFVADLPQNNVPGGIFDPTSQTWAYIATWAQERLDELRKKNDIIKNTDSLSSNDRTFLLRGQIKAMKDLLYIPKAVQEKIEKSRLHK